MKRWIFGAIALVGGSCLVGPTQANVVYQWQQLTSSATIDSSTGMLVIADNAWHNGPIDFEFLCNADAFAHCSVATSPVLELQFGINDFYPIDVVFDDNAEFSKLSGTLDWGSTGLNGFFDGEDFQGQMRLGSDDGIWNVGYWVSDEGCWLDEPFYCSGATGRWVLDRSTIPPHSVPAPAPLPLFAGGAVALLWLSQRRRRQQ